MALQTQKVHKILLIDSFYQSLQIYRFTEDKTYLSFNICANLLMGSILQMDLLNDLITGETYTQLHGPNSVVIDTSQRANSTQ